MKTVLAFVGAFALGALLLYLGMSSGLVPGPTPEPTPTPTPRPTCSELLGPGPRKAMVMVLWNRQDQCHLKTVPNRLHICEHDQLIWETSFIQQCRRYHGDLEIALKDPSSGDLQITPEPARATGQFGERPCPADEYCHLEYKVTLHPTGGGDPLVEDPNIDIWK